MDFQDLADRSVSDQFENLGEMDLVQDFLVLDGRLANLANQCLAKGNREVDSDVVAIRIIDDNSQYRLPVVEIVLDYGHLVAFSAQELFDAQPKMSANSRRMLISGALKSFSHLDTLCAVMPILEAMSS